jgi:uncharacterized DUF497 family protein
MALVFDWNESNRKHIARHRVTTTEAEQVVLNDPLDLEMQTEDGEERLIQLGKTNKGRILIVITTWRKDKIRVITAFRAPKQLQNLYLSHSS